MRIGIDLSAVWRPTTGMERVAIEMTRALLAHDTANDYVLFFCEDIHPELAQVVGRFEACVLPRSHELVTKHWRLPALIAGARLEYMHFPVFPPAWNLPCRFGWTLPDATPWIHPETMKISSRWYYRLFGRRALKQSSAIVTDTNSSKNDLVEKLRVPPGHVHVLYPGLQRGFFQLQDHTEFEGVRRRHCVPERFVLFVGTLEPRKNLPRIVEAFEHLRKQNSFEPELVVVGRRGWRDREILSRISRSQYADRIYLLGYVSEKDLVALYNMARMLVFPSLYEGFGLPGLEAMACGCPLVTSNKGALLEVSAGAAVYCDPQDAGSIAGAMLRAESDEALRARIIAAGLTRAASFSWKRYAEQFLKIVTANAATNEPEQERCFTR